MSAHLNLSNVSVDAVRDHVLHVAARINAGLAGAATQSLAHALEAATGCTIAELAEAMSSPR